MITIKLTKDNNVLTIIFNGENILQYKSRLISLQKIDDITYKVDLKFEFKEDFIILVKDIVCMYYYKYIDNWNDTYGIKTMKLNQQYELINVQEWIYNESKRCILIIKNI